MNMEPDNNNAAPKPEEQTPQTEPQAPADALSRTPDDLEQEEVAQVPAPTNEPQPGGRKPSALKLFFRKVNIYFLLFILLVIVAGAIAVVNYLNSQKVPEPASIASQDLSEEDLQELANTDASVGDASQTLTIQGNAIIEGQTLMRGDLNVAGNFQTGGSIQGPSLTISGESNLGTTQANSLQVAQNVAVQGSTTLSSLNVSGTSSFGGAMTASQITVSRLIMSGNASLEVPNHISFTGPSPSRSITSSVLGNGGSASINGSDTAGSININTGNNPSPGCFVSITFNQAFSKQPRVIISPVGSGASQTRYYVTRDNSGFRVCSSNAAPANQSFSFDYFVTN